MPVPVLGHRKVITLVLVHRSIVKWGLVHVWYGARHVRRRSWAHQTSALLRAPRESPEPRRRSASRSHSQDRSTRTHAALRRVSTAPVRRRRQQRRPHQTSRTNDYERRRKDAACLKGHNAGDAD